MTNKIARTVQEASVKPPRRTEPLNSAQILAVIGPVLQLWLETDMTLPRIAAEVTKKTGVVLNNTDPSRIVQIARKRGMIWARLPIDEALSQRLITRANGGDIHVARTYNFDEAKLALGGVAEYGASLVLPMISKVAKTKPEVHLGLGMGYMTARFAAALGASVAKLSPRPRIVVHMLGPSCMPSGPRAVLQSLEPLIELGDIIDLSNVPLVRADRLESWRDEPLLAPAFAGRDTIDIAVTSIARHADEHGHLRSWFERHDPSMVERLTGMGCIGELQLNPYGPDGPLHFDDGLKPLSLFGLDELAAMAQQPGKHVVLLVAPCGQCHIHKAEALAPMLDQPSLRVWNHLVVDVETALAVCSAAETA